MAFRPGRCCNPQPTDPDAICKPFLPRASYARQRPLSGPVERQPRRKSHVQFAPPSPTDSRKGIRHPPRPSPRRQRQARLIAFAEGWTAMHRTARQHRGPITRAFMEVLKAMLWGFHNSKTGHCFPSYETIAAKAKCNRDTVYEAIKIFEQAEILTWVNRITRIRVQDIDLLGRRIWRWQIIRTSNSYIFRDPLPCAPHRESYKSENPTGTPIQDVTPSKNLSTVVILDPTNPLDSALIRLGTTLGALPTVPKAP